MPEHVVDDTVCTFVFVVSAELYATTDDTRLALPNTSQLWPPTRTQRLHSVHKRRLTGLPSTSTRPHTLSLFRSISVSRSGLRLLSTKSDIRKSFAALVGTRAGFIRRSPHIWAGCVCVCTRPACAHTSCGCGRQVGTGGRRDRRGGLWEPESVFTN